MTGNAVRVASAADPIAGLVASATAAGAGFRLSGARVAVTGLHDLPEPILLPLRDRRDEVWDHLGGTKLDRPSQELLDQLGVAVAVPRDEAEALALVAEMEADADQPGNRGLLGFDIETAALPGEETRPVVALTRAGAPKVSQPGLKGGAGLDPRRATVRLAQLYGGGKRCLVIDTRIVPLKILAPVLGRRRMAIHHAKFEIAFLAHAGIAVPNFECTMQAAGLLLGVHRRGLDDAASAYLGIDLPKGLQTSDWGAAELSDGQIAYAAIDAIMALRLWLKMRVELVDKQRGDAYLLQRDIIPVVARMEARGVLLDQEEHHRQVAAWNEVLAGARQKMESITGQRAPTKAAEIIALLNRVLDIDTLMSWPRTSKSGQLSTRRADLQRAERVPGIEQVIDIEANKKLISSFGERLAAKVSPSTGRLHAEFNIAGAKTGRFTSSEPNLQNIPARKAAGFRNCFVAAPGHVFVTGDYSAMELRAAAEIADDTVLRDDFANGVDLHRQTAAAMHGIPSDEVTEAQRNAAKAINFGTIYGSGGGGLAASAWRGQRIDMSVEAAEEGRDKFLTRYNALARWMRANANECQRRGFIAIGKFGRVVEAAWEMPQPGKGGQGGVPLYDEDGDEDGEDVVDDVDEDDDPLRFIGVNLPSHPALRYPQCCNVPIQGACADVIMLAMLWIDTALTEAGIEGGLVLTVHDELVIEVPEDRADETAALLQRYMESAFAKVFPKAPLTDLVKLGRGRTWGGAK